MTKKLILATLVAIAGWIGANAQSMPAPEKYNQFLEQVSKMDNVRGTFLMKTTMETLAKDPKAYRQMMELAERRFSDAADSIHNEALYMAVLEHAAEKFTLSAAERERQRLLLEGAKKNMEGSIATDFDYVLPNDKTVHRLKELQAENILIYFNNPDCESCEKVKERLANSELINRLVNEKKLIVLAIYPYDDQKLWKKTKYPKMMINGWNQSRQIEYNELYDLPTLPCFYLLDKDYKVLIKNEGSLKKVEAKLTDLYTPKAPEPPAMPKKKVTPEEFIPKDAAIDDPNTIQSERILNLLINNKYQEVYELMSDDLKADNEASFFDGAFAKVQNEAKTGNYIGHESWKTQTLHGHNAYTSILNFENVKIGLIFVYGEDGKVQGLQFVPAQVIQPPMRTPKTAKPDKQ